MKDYGKTVVQTIALTWAPNAKLFPFIKPSKQFDAHIKILINLDKSCYYEIYPEFHLSGNLHYHFIIKIFDKIKWFKHTLVKLRHYGFVYPKPLTDYDGWVKYCGKSVKEAEGVLNIDVPIKDLVNIKHKESEDDRTLEEYMVSET